MTELTTIQLTPVDAQKFIQFQKYYAFITLMDNIGAFDMRNGNVVINFNSEGEIAKISKQEFYIPQDINR